MYKKLLHKTNSKVVRIFLSAQHSWIMFNSQVMIQFHQIVDMLPRAESKLFRYDDAFFIV